MQHFDLLLAWNWEYDRDFIGLLGTACASHGLTFLPVGIDNLETVLGGLQGGELTISTFMDRASDTDPRFLGLLELIRKKEIFQINPHDQATWSTDKATMHLEFISRGLDTPYTILLPPVCEQPDLPILELHPLGERFAVKPAHLGGGEGVVLDVTTMEEVSSIRRQHPGEKYLLQAQVTPQVLGGRPAWFRVLVCSGAVYPCWWDPRRHVYSRLTRRTCHSGSSQVYMKCPCALPRYAGCSFSQPRSHSHRMGASRWWIMSMTRWICVSNPRRLMGFRMPSWRTSLPAWPGWQQLTADIQF